MTSTSSSKPRSGAAAATARGGALYGDEWKATSISGPRLVTLGSQSPPQYSTSTGSSVEPPSYTISRSRSPVHSRHARSARPVLFMLATAIERLICIL